MPGKVFACAAFAACLAAGGAVARAAPIIYTTSTPLSVLVAGAANGDGIVVGDKAFVNFSYNATGDMPISSNVNVIPITDAAGNFGVRFQGGFVDTALSSGPSDAFITYDVFVLDPRFRISDAHLLGNPAVLSGAGAATVTESFTDLTNPLLQFLTIYDLSPGNYQPQDIVDFTPSSFAALHVNKDIALYAQPTKDIPYPVSTLSFVDQTFSQTPEPASLALFALGTVGLLLRRRKA